MISKNEESKLNPKGNIFENQRLFTVKQAAIYLSYDKQTVYEIIAIGEIPHIPFGKRGIRIDRKDLDKYVDENKRTKKRRTRRTRQQLDVGVN
jgi:excisionase family DNA binding protein